MQGIYPGSWQVSWKGPKGTGRDGEVPASQGPGDSAWRMRQDTQSNYVTYVSELGGLNTDTATLGQGAGDEKAWLEASRCRPRRHVRKHRLKYSSDTQQGLPEEGRKKGSLLWEQGGSREVTTGRQEFFNSTPFCTSQLSNHGHELLCKKNLKEASLENVFIF